MYQRYVSPLKGFVCAYRMHTGRCSCSEIGFRAIRRYGLRTGFGVLRMRMNLCGVAHQRFLSKKPSLFFRYQRGHCDLPIDVGCLSCGCDLASSFGSCDIPWNTRSRGNDKYVYIPPNSGIGKKHR
uniref:membrane protein insertion efficiency factor YidD n=1 Tax=Rhodoferax sp. GW822-FHT02A01 TaxID=3141537 RepID=UPI00406C6297